MAKCKLCKTGIPDGTEYCIDCKDKRNTVSNESYLDSLLNSVKNTVPSTESIYKKKTSVETSINSNSKSISPEPESEGMPDPDLQDFMSYKVDLGDIEDFDQYFMDDDLQKDIVIGDEELFGKDYANILSNQETNQKKDKKSSEVKRSGKKITVDQVTDHIDLEALDKPEKINTPEEEENTATTTLEDELYPEEKGFQPEQIVLSDEDKGEVLANEEDFHEEVYYSDENQTDNIEEEDIPTDHLDNNFNPNEISELGSEDDYDADLNDLLNNLDNFQTSSSDTYSSEDEEPMPSMQMEFEPADTEEFEQIDQEEDDFLALLNQISSDDPVAGDVKAINDLLSGTTVPTKKSAGTPSDVGEVFSDALKVVSSLSDDEEEAALLAQIPDAKEKKRKKPKKDKNENRDKVVTDEEGIKKPKKGLFQRLFGNIKDETTPKKKAVSSKFNGEEAVAQEPKKKGKAKKPKKGEPSKDLDDDIEEGRGKGSKGKDGKDKENKKEKKEKKKKTKEIIQVIDEIEEDEGRINRLGAIIVFVFFGLLAALLLVGTNMVSYTLSIQNATTYFDKQKYTEAYNEVYGMDINDEDIEIYDKIMTVMFVNKQLNSYNSYYSLGMYPEALDSLLKGLKRYDKYIELATILGIETDLNYVRKQILGELDNIFHLSEEEAMRINSFESMGDYSLEVYNVVLENMRY